MVKMALNSSLNQATSSRVISVAQINAYEEVIASLECFVNADDLQGRAYESAKDFVNCMLIPLIRGAILLSEVTNKAISSLPGRYINEVSNESLDSEVLEAQIRAYQGVYSRTNDFLTDKMSQEVLSDNTIFQLRQLESRVLYKLRDLQDKLNRLIWFDNSPSILFEEVNNLDAVLSQGISQIDNVFASFDGAFLVPAPNELAWTQSIRMMWDSYEIKTLYLRVLEKISNNGELTDEDIQAIYRYADMHRGEPVDPRLLCAISNFSYGSIPFSSYWSIAAQLEDTTQINFDSLLDCLFGYEFAMSVTYEFRRQQNALFSTYFKNKTMIVERDSGVFQLKANEGPFGGIGIDLGLLSAELNLEDWRINVAANANLFGYTFGAKADFGLSAENLLELDVALGGGISDSEKVDTHYYGLKASVNIFAGIVGGYHQHTYSGPDGIANLYQTEEGIQLGNIVELLLLAEIVTFGPEIVAASV